MHSNDFANKKKSELIKEIESLRKENNNLKIESQNKSAIIDSYYNIYQNTTIGLYKTTPSGEIVYANRPLVKMLGFDSFDELKKYNLADEGLISENNRTKFLNTIYQKNSVLGYENIWFKKSGEIIYIKESARTLKDKNGVITDIIGTVEDITQQKEKELELEKSEKRYRKLVDFMPFGVVVHSKGHIRYLNKVALDFFDVRDVTEVKDSTVYKYIRKDFWEITAKRQKNILETGISPKPIEIPIIKPDGTEVIFEVNTTLITFHGEKALLSVFNDISLRKEYEEKLKISETTYKNILNSVSEALFIQDKDGTFLNVNDASKTIFGYNRNELIGKTQKKLSAKRKNNMQKIKKHIRDAYNGKHQFFEFNGLTKRGKIIPVEVSLSPTKYFNKNAVIAVVRNVSKQKEAEQKIIQSERKYRELINFAVGGILVGDINGYIIEANSHICKLMGRKEKDILGKHITDGFFTPESISKNPLRFDLLEKGEIVKNQREIQRPDGSKIWVEMHSKKIPGNLFQSIYHDITDRIKTEKQIMQSKKLAEQINIKRESLLKAIPDIMFTFDKYGYIIDYHANNEDNLFLKPKDFIRKNAMEVLPKEVGQKTIEKISKVLKTKAIEKHTYTLKINDENHYFDSRLVYLDKNSVLAVVRDVTERIKLIVELKDAKEKAEEGHRMASAFLSNLSHEIRTPMNGILGFAELLKDEELTPDEKSDYINIIEKSGKQLIAILNDIIEISRIEAGHININKSEFDITELMDNLHTLFKIIIASKKGIELKITKTYNVLISGDKVKVQQILSNLIDNAIKFTNSGKIEVGYNVTKDNYIEFYVKDTGIGISEKDKQIIFQRFRQGENSKSSLGGSGLGLSISKAYAELMGGDIRLDSTIGVGSVFFVKIPLYQ